MSVASASEAKFCPISRMEGCGLARRIESFSTTIDCAGGVSSAWAQSAPCVDAVQCHCRNSYWRTAISSGQVLPLHISAQQWLCKLRELRHDDIGHDQHNQCAQGRCAE